MRYIITQHYTTEHADMFNLVGPVNSAYAAANGFEYISECSRLCPDRNFYWEKVAWINKVLSTVDEGSLVVFEDCDSVNISGDLKNALPPGYMLGMVPLVGGLDGKHFMNWYNDGIIIMLNTKEVRNFFGRVWLRHETNDEKSVNGELKENNYNVSTNNPVYNLDMKWNCWNNNSKIVQEPFIKTWHGMQYADKLTAISSHLNS